MESVQKFCVRCGKETVTAMHCQCPVHSKCLLEWIIDDEDRKWRPVTCPDCKMPLTLSDFKQVRDSLFEGENKLNIQNYSKTWRELEGFISRYEMFESYQEPTLDEERSDIQSWSDAPVHRYDDKSFVLKPCVRCRLDTRFKLLNCDCPVHFECLLDWILQNERGRNIPVCSNCSTFICITDLRRIRFHLFDIKRRFRVGKEITSQSVGAWRKLQRLILRFNILTFEESDVEDYSEDECELDSMGIAYEI